MTSVETAERVRQVKEIFPDVPGHAVEDYVVLHPTKDVNACVDYFLGLSTDEAQNAEMSSPIPLISQRRVNGGDRKRKKSPETAQPLPHSSRRRLCLSTDPPASIKGRRELLARVTENRLAGVEIPEGDGRIRYVESTPSGEFRDQMAAIRREREREWRSETPRTMTIADLSDLDRRKEETVAKWGSGKDEQVPRSAIHTLDSSLHDSIALGKEELRLTNEFRARNGLRPLKWHQSLAEIGQVHSKNMAEHKVPLGHSGFNGRVSRFPFSSRKAAENVAMSSGYSDVARTHVDGWIHSPGHCRNLKGDFVYCGIGIYFYGDTCYATQLFATPM